MNKPINVMLQQLAPLNREPALRFWHDLQVHIPDAAGSTRSHHAWPGGYEDHVQECMNLARIMYARLSRERKIEFPLRAAYLVLFLHDCEKPFRHATNRQLKAFSWITVQPTKSDKQFQKRLIEYYGFVLSDAEWNALRYVEGEPESEYQEGTRLQGPLAAFCHVCDTLSARMWHNFPEQN